MGKKFTKQMIKWVNINHILSSKICNKNVENHHCKSDCAKTYVKSQEYCKYKPDLSSKICNEIIVNHYCKSDLGQKFLKEMIKWVNTNHILSSKICNKNVENHHCKSDFVQTQL